MRLVVMLALAFLLAGCSGSWTMSNGPRGEEEVRWGPCWQQPCPPKKDPAPAPENTPPLADAK